MMSSNNVSVKNFLLVAMFFLSDLHFCCLNQGFDSPRLPQVRVNKDKSRFSESHYSITACLISSISVSIESLADIREFKKEELSLPFIALES